MESLDYWRLCDELSIVHAALLTVGVDPSSEEGANCDRWKEHEQPKGYLAVKSAMIRAIMAESLPAKLRYWDEPDCRTEPATNWCESSVSVDDLRTWLRSRGFTAGFFFPNEEAGRPGYLDPKHPRYPPKLAAAVSAWLAVEDPNGRSPKQALERWLREHAAEFGLTDDEGNPVNTAMEECSKVANWQPGGGASKTPG